MNDPHVERLHYTLTHVENLEFRPGCPAQTAEMPAFQVRLQDKRLSVELSGHHPSVESAMACVDPFIRAWEIQANLKEAERLYFKFRFDSADVIDRNPLLHTPGVVALAGTCHLKLTAHPARLVGTRSEYPPPPDRFVLSPDVGSMWHRYRGFLAGREPLLSMAYFCLTVLEGAPSLRGNRRRGVCTLYRLSEDVRELFGDITSDGGDPHEARKFAPDATKKPLTDRQKEWVEAVVKRLIRRKGEYDADPSTAASLPEITLSDFPPVSFSG